MEITAQALASLCGGRVDGDDSVTVSDFAKIEEAGPGDLAFISNPKYAHYAATTGASIILVAETFEKPQGLKATLVRVEDPYTSLARLMTMVANTRPRPRGVENPVHIGEGTELPEEIYLGAFSYIGKNVSIGEGSLIYPQVYIGDGSVIGKDAILYPGVKVYAGCKIGNRCVIHAGAVIGADGFGFAPMADGTYRKIPQIGITIIEDDVEIGANTTVDRATMGATIVHRGAKLDNLIMAAHNTEIGHDTVMAAQSGIAGSTKIGSNCMIGGQVGFAGHIHVGDRVQIAAQSGVPHSVADDSRIMGSPACEANDYMRQTVYLKHLGELFDRVAALEKTTK